MKLIYSYTNLVNNKKYIGQTNNLKRRISQHKQDSSFNYCDSRYRQLIHQSFLKKKLLIYLKFLTLLFKELIVEILKD